MSRILIIDDELSMREFLEIYFRKMGHEVRCAADGQAGVDLLEAEAFDLVITDLSMPGMGGLEVLEHSRNLHPDTPVLMITAYASTQTALDAMKLGAYDYFTKPFKLDQIGLTVRKALERRRLAVENHQLRSALTEGQLDTNDSFEGIIGRSTIMRRLFGLIDQVSGAPSNILINGESGTGKELVARAIHNRSDRRDQPFLVLNCGAVPENLIEAELFGHRRGAFTGADRDRQGMFNAAEGGSLLLDEIGEMPLQMQVKLLRVLQNGKIRAVGDFHEVAVDVRVLAATHRDLEAEVAAGRFREDLYYRLNVIRVDLPPLRERPEDIPLLVHHFIQKYARAFNRPVPTLAPAVMRALMSHNFSGNVRELENLIERAVALSDDHRIGLRALPPTLLDVSASPTPTTPAPTPSVSLPMLVPESGLDLEDALERYERHLITAALERTGGRKKQAARLLGISFRSLRYRLEKLKIEGGRDDTLDESLV
ncbi:MAG: sigma-54-dependent transcriptional regulator [Bradymonadia bacterium]